MTLMLRQQSIPVAASNFVKTDVATQLKLTSCFCDAADEDGRDGHEDTADGGDV